MVVPSKRSRTYRRVFVKTPGGRVTMHYRRRRPGKPECGRCHAFLAGVPRGLPVVMRTLNKSQKRPERTFGGVYCSRCTKEILKAKARQ